MIKKIFVLIFLFFSFSGFCQTQGDIDPAFNPYNTPAQLRGANTDVTDLLVQSDGKILFVGSFNRYNGKVANGITRINSDGSKDPSFNPQNSNIGQEICCVKTVGVQSNGKIIIGGDFTYFNDQVTYTNRIVGLNSDGTKNTSFTIGTGFNGNVEKILVLPNDKILVFGDFTSYNGSIANRIVRLNSNGTIDNTFLSGVGTDKIVRDALFQPDGKILISGDFTTYSGAARKNVARLNGDGTLDTSFSLGTGFHMETYVFTSSVSNISLQADGKIIAVGNFTMFNGLSQKGLARLNSDGTIDATFNIGTGLIVGENTGKTWIAQDGKILLSGVVSYNETPIKGLIRLNSNGSIDNSFNTRKGFDSGVVLGLAFISGGKILAGGDFAGFDGIQGLLFAINDDGSPDLTFNGGKGFNGEVKATVTQPDGKIIVGGNFHNYNNTVSSKIIRLNTNGSIDSSFRIGTGFDYSVSSLVLQPDGKILVAGDFTMFNNVSNNGLIRLNSDGSLDSSFNMSTVLTYNYVYHYNNVTLQSDGKILLSGYFVCNNTNAIIRLNSDGSIDPSFNVGTGTNTYGLVLKTVQQPDGKILVAGNFSSFNNVPAIDMVRLNSNGSVDNSFNIGIGPTDAAMDSDIEVIEDISLQPDGKVILGGNFPRFNGLQMNKIARVNGDGTLDTTFSSVLTYTGADHVRSIALQPDGKILIVGDFYGPNSKMNILRLNSNGSHDASFSGSFDIDHTVNFISLQPGGKILVGGDFTLYSAGSTYTVVNRLVRVSSNGAKDVTFNESPGFNDTVHTIVTQTDGKIIVGGDFTAYNGVESNRIIRLSNNGTIDTAFNCEIGFNNSVNVIALDANNRILVGGNFTSYKGVTANRLIRLNSDGSIDTSFVTGTGFNNRIYSIAVQSDGKIVVAGSFSTYNGVIAFDLVRLNSDGSVDTSFVTGSGLNDKANSVAIQSDGKIIVCGNFTSYNNTLCNRIIRLNNDGSIDGGFAVGLGSDNEINNVVLQPNGKILIGGNFDSFNGNSSIKMARLNSDGSFDSSFNIGYGFDFRVNKIVVQQDGKIIAGGYFVNFNGTSVNRLVRLNANGSRDSVFNTTNGFDSSVNTMALLNDGKVLVGGMFTNYKTVAVNRIVCLYGDTNVLSTAESASMLNKEKVLVVYPNPVQDVLFFTTPESNVSSYEIYDIMGKKIDGKTINNEKGIYVGSLKSGVYLILFKTDTEKLTTKFIKS